MYSISIVFQICLKHFNMKNKQKSTGTLKTNKEVLRHYSIYTEQMEILYVFINSYPLVIMTISAI